MRSKEIDIIHVKKWDKIYHRNFTATIYLNWSTHTDTFNGPLSGTTQVSRYQKGKTNLNLTKARDSEWQWHQLGHMQVCTSLQTDNNASTAPLCFLQAGCPSCRPTNSIKALKAVKVLYCAVLYHITFTTCNSNKRSKETICNNVIRTHETETFSAQIWVHDFHAVSKTLMEQATSVPINMILSTTYNNSKNWNKQNSSTHSLHYNNPCLLISQFT